MPRLCLELARLIPRKPDSAGMSGIGSAAFSSLMQEARAFPNSFGVGMAHRTPEMARWEIGTPANFPINCFRHSSLVRPSPLSQRLYSETGTKGDSCIRSFI